MSDWPFCPECDEQTGRPPDPGMDAALCPNGHLVTSIRPTEADAADARHHGLTAHPRWVERGYCPAVSRSKSWCNKKAGHVGRHGSMRIPTPARAVSESMAAPNLAWVEWET